MSEQEVVQQAAPSAEAQAAEAVESNAAFESGFNKERGIEAPKVEKPAEVVQAKAEDKPEAKAEPEKWEGISKDQFESITKKLETVDKLPDRLRNIEGHIGGLTSQLKTALAAKTVVEAKGGEAPSAAQVQDASKSTDRWKQLKTDFPDWADAIDERFASIAAPKEVDIAGLKKEVATDVDKRIADAKAEARTLARIDAKHDGWETTVNSPEFKAWFDKQPPEFRALGDSKDAKDAIKVLDAFVDAGKKAKEDKTQRLKGAITPKGVPAAGPTTINDDEALERGFKRVRG